MILVAQMQSGGVFEAASKRKLTDAMIQHFAENNQDAGQIKGVFCVLKDDRIKEFCSEVVEKFQNIIDEGVQYCREQQQQWESEHEMLRSDYRASR